MITIIAQRQSAVADVLMLLGWLRDRAVPCEQAAACQEGPEVADVPDVPDGVRGAGAGLMHSQ